MTTITSDSIVTELEDRLAIIELIGRLSLVIDAKDWDAMGQLRLEARQRCRVVRRTHATSEGVR